MRIKYWLQDENDGEGGDLGGGGEQSLEQSLNDTFDDVGKELKVDTPAGGEQELKKPTENGTTVKQEEKPPSQGAPAEKKGPPKSWKQEMHPHWEKTPPEVQSYWQERENDFHKGIEGYKGAAAFGKQFNDVVAPYRPLLEAQGIKEPHIAVQYLLSAHQQLSNPDANLRAQYFRKLADLYGIDTKVLSGIVTEHEQADPAIQQLTQEVNNLKGHITAEQRARFEETKNKVDTEVETFAKDPAHPYFDEVSADIAILLRGSDEMSLNQAYERAVWANPVTRAKEQARVQKDTEATLRKEAEEKAAAKLKARGTHVRGQDADRGPTDFLGSMEDTMREAYQKINSRSH